MRARAHDLVSTSEEFLQASWANAAAGNSVPIDLEGVLGTASHWTLAQAREHALDLGLPWWSITPFAAPRSADLTGARRVEVTLTVRPGRTAHLDLSRIAWIR